ncbi:MAG TPA: phage major capsid protein [Acidobacteriaceae bacterium]|jgi:HK97 family phage major capsid protein|nr:phage major capsid protein [Acidobacteriaceae bacterium]
MIDQIKALREQRARLIADAQALIPAGNKAMNAEQRGKFDRMIADAQVLKGTIDNLETLDAEQRSQTARAANNPRPGQHAESTAKSNLRDFMRTGERRAAISTGSTSGGYLLNQEMYPEIVEAQKMFAGLSLALKPWHTDTGIPVKVPMSNDTANLASDITDGAASTEVEVPLTGFISQVDDFDSGYVLVTVAELEDANYDVEAFVRNRLSKRIYRALAQKLVTGGTNIQSVITSATAGNTSAAPTTVGYADLVGLYSQLDPAYLPNAKWVMNQGTRNSLLSIMDNYGRPLFVPSVNKDELDTILGHPVVISPYHPVMAAGVAGCVQFGDFSEGFTLRDVSNMMLFRLVERWLPDYGSYGFLAKARFGAFATNAGTNPVYNLIQHA